MSDWKIYQGKGGPHDVDKFPKAPPWRNFSSPILNEDQVHSENDAYGDRLLARDETFQISEREVALVNAALHLRRPLLVGGQPGLGKSSLAYAVARELKLGQVLRWSITSSTKLSDGLYRYDAISRLQDSSQDIGEYIRLGPLGSALLASKKPRVLLIDEIDKSDIDLPNDLLHVFEEGEFEIPELVRLSKKQPDVEVYYGTRGNTKVKIQEGRVRCHEFPFVVLTSNDEREFPPAFLRRCLRLKMEPPSQEKLEDIVKVHLGLKAFSEAKQLIAHFLKLRNTDHLATDQLLNAIYLTISCHIDEHGDYHPLDELDKEKVLEAVLRPLSNV